MTMTSNDPSRFSRLTRFFYQHICPRCAPESFHLDQTNDQPIRADLLYVFDPLQIEVRTIDVLCFSLLLIRN